MIAERGVRGREQTRWTGTAWYVARRCTPWLFALHFCRFWLSYAYFHIRISGPKFDFWISINNSSIGAFPCDCPQHVHATFLIIVIWNTTCVQVWNLTNCKLKTNHYGHTGYVNTVTVSPDGSLCASGGKVSNDVSCSVDQYWPVALAACKTQVWLEWVWVVTDECFHLFFSSLQICLLNACN